MSFSDARLSRAPVLGCFAIAAAAVLIHGYHLGTDDAAIWVPAIKKAADRSLYPFGNEFFLHHSNLSAFPLLLGWLIRLTHTPSDTIIFFCHFAGIFLLLLAVWQLLSACFDNHRARWAGVALIAATLNVPVAGTALVIMDPYVTSRTLSTPFALFAIAAHLSERSRAALIWLAICFLVHPQMSLYTAFLLGFMELNRRRVTVLEPLPVFGMLGFITLSLPWRLEPAHDAAREALLSRTYFFVSNWTWYEWLGVIAPLALLWWISRLPLRSTAERLKPVLRSMIILGALSTIAGMVLSSSPRLENYTRLQPMRAFHLIYILMFAVLGALAGEYVLRDRRWRWAALFAPLAAGMWMLAITSFPDSSHIEWPWLASQNNWSSAFLWIRIHTPKDATFAMNPDYLLLPGEDMHGFRAIAERSVLADRVKDSGAVSLFPELAYDWSDQVKAQDALVKFRSADELRRLSEQYPVSWIVTRTSRPGIVCPYRNTTVAVCRIVGSTPEVASVVPAVNN